MTKFSRGPWRAAVRTTRAGQRQIEVRNTSRDPVAIVFTNKYDAQLMAGSLKLLDSLKHLIAIVRMFEPQLRVSAKAKLAQAIALVDELEGES